MVDRSGEDHLETGTTAQPHPESFKTFGNHPVFPNPVLNLQQAKGSAMTFMAFSLRSYKITLPVPSVTGDREGSEWAYTHPSARAGLPDLLEDALSFSFIH